MNLLCSIVRWFFESMGFVVFDGLALVIVAGVRAYDWCNKFYSDCVLGNICKRRGTRVEQ